MARLLGLPRVGALALVGLMLAIAPAVAQSPSPSLPPAPPAAAPGGGPVAAAATSAPSATVDADIAMSTLVDASELPKGFHSDGPKAGSDFDIAESAFNDHGGQAVASQVWNRDGDSGPLIAFDFRMVFPTPEDAVAYLDDAEDTISERVASGLKLVKKSSPVGEHHRLYAGTSEVAGKKVRFENHLFTVGRIAAKVFVGALTGGDTRAEANAIALAAAKRMADAQPAPVAITPPPSTPEPSAGPDVAPVLEAILMARVAGHPDCEPVRERSFDGELAAISCPIGDNDELLVMRQLDTPETLATVFTDFSGSDPGDVGACRTGPALEPRMIGGERVGQLDCYDATDGTRVFIWTDERFHILSWFISTKDRPFDQLYEQYASAGPLDIDGPSASPDASAEPLGSGAPFPTDAEADLLAHVPDALRDTCDRAGFAVSDDATAAVVCEVTVGDGSITVTYQSYGDAAAMNAGYDGNLAFMGVDRDTGPCKGEWPGEAGYNISGELAGRVGCSEFGDTARFMSWTDERLLIHGYAEGFDVARDDMYQWWLDESGPI